MENEEVYNCTDQVKRIAIGADHGSYDSKEMLKLYLQTIGYIVTDVGTNNSIRKVDYPDFAAAVARKVVSGECDRGIMLDAAGIGSSIACNKIRGIRAALCWSLKIAINSREHNNSNILTMGTAQHTPDELCAIAKLWLETRFKGGRHWPRINKILALERIGN